MATALKTTLHPEAARQLALPTWTADPAVKPLFSAIRTLQPVAETLADLSADRPSINRCVADELGRLTTRHYDTGRFGVPDEVKTVGTGVIGSIWDELDALRQRWIDARLTSEGLRSDMADFQRWFDRREQLSDEALPVGGAWVAFQKGAL
jgi:hypothetical protein